MGEAAQLADRERAQSRQRLAGQLGGAMAELGRALREDPALQWQVNRFARRTAVGVASRYGAQIVQLVSEPCAAGTPGLTTRIESAVGRDLQFIRINGTLVGGLVASSSHGGAMALTARRASSPNGSK
jgi:uncharacterized membrane-anchored protein YjiN (DUF445 family)